MSGYEPPTATYPIFDSLAFQTPNSASLTIADADQRYLARNNIAISNATLTSFAGDVTVGNSILDYTAGTGLTIRGTTNGESIFMNVLNAGGVTKLKIELNPAHTHLYDAIRLTDSSAVTNYSTLQQILGVCNMSNTTVNSSITNFLTRTSGGVSVTPLSLSSTAVTVNLPMTAQSIAATTAFTSPIIQNVNSGSAGLTIRNQASNTGSLNIQQLGTGTMVFSSGGITNLTLQSGYTTFESAIAYSTNLTALSGTVDLSSIALKEFYTVNAASVVSIQLPSPLSFYGRKITFRRSAGTATITFTTDQVGGPNLEIVAFNSVTATTTATMINTQYTSTFYCNASLWYQAVY